MTATRLSRCICFDMASQSTTGPLHQAAKEWAERGFYVFPCTPNAKTPATSNGVHDATLDPEQIDAWWSENPSYNVAVAPARSAMFVLDSDPPLGEETIASLELDHGLLPTTLTVRTPRGGLHRWFLGECGTTASKLGPKVDTRGVGGYVLIPPSVVNGVAYETIAAEDIATAPAWIPERCAALRGQHHSSEDFHLDDPGNVERARQFLRSEVALGRIAVEGSGGDDRTYRTACEVLNLGLSPYVAWEVMRDEWNPHCIPPWDGEELAVKVRNAAEYAQNDIGAWGVLPAQEVFAEAIALAAKELPSGKTRSKFYPEDEDEQNLARDPAWLLPNLIPDVGTVMMYGPSRSYKSFLALDMALTIASGIAGWKCPARNPRAVVYIGAEGPRSVKRLRRPAWKLAKKIETPLPFYFIGAAPLVVAPNQWGEMIEEIKSREIKPAFIVLDTVARAMAGLNENDAKDAGQLVEAVESLARAFNCAVMAVHHSGNESGRARGSTAFFGGVDTVLEVAAKNSVKAASVYVRKQKDAEEPQAPWTFQGQIIGPSLVFSETDTRTHQALTDEDQIFSPRKIGAALRQLRAIGSEAGVTTHVLAEHLAPRLEGETAEDRARVVAGFARRLGSLARSHLEAYSAGHGRELHWFIPDAVETQTGTNGSTGTEEIPA